MNYNSWYAKPNHTKPNYGLIVGQTELFSYGKATTLGESALWN